MDGNNRWRGPDAEYTYDWYAMDLELHIPNQLVEDVIHERGWLEEYGAWLDWFESNASTEAARRITKEYLDETAERYEYEHCNPYEREGGWKVRAVVYGIKDLDIQTLLGKQYVDSVWMGDGENPPEKFTAETF